MDTSFFLPRCLGTYYIFIQSRGVQCVAYYGLYLCGTVIVFISGIPHTVVVEHGYVKDDVVREYGRCCNSGSIGCSEYDCYDWK